MLRAVRDVRNRCEGLTGETARARGSRTVMSHRAASRKERQAPTHRDSAACTRGQDSAPLTWHMPHVCTNASVRCSLMPREALDRDGGLPGATRGPWMAG